MSNRRSTPDTRSNSEGSEDLQVQAITYSRMGHQPAPQLQHSDYTVLWIAVLPTDLTVAEAMLDEYHEPLPTIKGDSNYYIPGRISQHNVVIAILPKGIYGGLSAAHVSRDARRSFPALRYSLLVGTGGGVPSAHNDIRLGDVISGTQVMPYTPAKRTAQGIVRTGLSMRPDEGLLKVVMRLEAKREENLEKISLRMQHILDATFVMLPHFGHPHGPDDLFDPSYSHVDQGTLHCREKCDHQLQTIRRHSRPSKDPRIHSGVIASGDWLMKNGQVRDELAGELNALCFEMESAGAMRTLSCLPIRGVSNYADSHKNDDWQRYAAATAAAYARELLETLPGPIHQDRNNPGLGWKIKPGGNPEAINQGQRILESFQSKKPDKSDQRSVCEADRGYYR